MASFVLKAGVFGCLLVRVAAFALPAQDSATSELAGWTAAGCYSDYSGARTLSHRVLESSCESMTVEKCVGACHAAGYLIAGLEYYGECYCDQSFRNGGSVIKSADPKKCTTPCNGNKKEMCGGSNRLNVYTFSPAKNTPRPSSSSYKASSTRAATPTLTLTSYKTTSCKTSSTRASTPATSTKASSGSTCQAITVTMPGPGQTITIPGAGEVTTVTMTGPGETQISTLTIPGAGEITTVTVPTTVTLPGEGELTTVTVPTTLTIPGAGEVTTVTIPGPGATITEPASTITVPTTLTIPGAGEVTTITVPTTLTLPGAGEVTTVTVPTTLAGEITTITVPTTLAGEITTVTIPGAGEVTTVTVPTTLAGEITTVTVPTTLAGEITTVTIPGAGEVTTVTVPTTLAGEITTITVPTTLAGEITTVTVPTTIPASTVTTTTTTTTTPVNTCAATAPVVNPGFEQDQLNTGAWKMWNANNFNFGAAGFIAESPNTGVRALQMQGTATNWGATVRQVLTVCPGQQYLFKGYGRANGATGNCQMWYMLGTTMMGTKFIPSTAYTAMADVFTVPAGVTSIPLELWVSCSAAGVANKVFFDDISLTSL